MNSDTGLPEDATFDDHCVTRPADISIAPTTIGPAAASILYANLVNVLSVFREIDGGENDHEPVFHSADLAIQIADADAGVSPRADIVDTRALSSIRQAALVALILEARDWQDALRGEREGLDDIIRWSEDVAGLPHRCLPWTEEETDRQQDRDQIVHFSRDELVAKPGTSYAFLKIYDAYLMWSEKQDLPQLMREGFLHQLHAAGYETTLSFGHLYVCGVVLQADGDPTDD